MGLAGALRSLAFAALVALPNAAQGQAAQTLTRPELERRVELGAAFLAAEGAAPACRAFGDPAQLYFDDAGYLFVLARRGGLFCHPRQDLIGAFGAARRSYLPDMLAAAERAAPEGAWTDYPWPHFETLRIQTKSTFCRVVADYAVCAGAHFLDAVSVVGSPAREG